jgi:hypothetical protein
VQALNDKIGEAVAAGINLIPLTSEAVDGATLEFAGLHPEGWPFIKKPTGYAFQASDGQMGLIYDITTPEEVDALLTQFGITDRAAQLLETRTANGVDWTIVGVNSGPFAYHAAIAEIDGATYVITLASPANIVGPLTEALLYPAIDAFTLVP